MKKKKIIIIILVVILLILLGVGGYFFFYKKDNNNLTSADRQWIEKNKNEIIDISIINNIPVFNYDGDGVLFDLLTNLKEETGLDFNELPYSTGDSDGLGLILTDELQENDKIIYKDNYVILSKDKVSYNNVEDIKPMVLGVAKEDSEDTKYYLKSNRDLTYKEYSSYTDLLSEIKNENTTIDGIVIPKITYLKEILENDDLSITYNISDMYKSIVLRLGDNDKLNDILTKYLNNWLNTQYNDSFNSHFTSSYFNFKGIDEQEKTNFKTGKTYTYGFVAYAPYISIVNKKVVGINYNIIDEFARLNDIEIKWKEYKSNKELVDAFNKGEFDFFLDTTANLEYNVETAISNTKFDDAIAIVSKNNDDIIKSPSSLKDKNVITIKDSKIAEYLSIYDIKTKTYDKLIDLLKNKKEDDIVVLDYMTYEIYKDKYFKDYQVDTLYNLSNNYHFVSNNKEENKVFNDYFMFYLNYTDVNQYKNVVSANNFKENNIIKFGPIIALIVLIILVIFLIVSIVDKVKNREKKYVISKEDKIKYIDSLTSLKNRAYLNDSIENWDESDIYPQAIVIIDLNNVAYINDNYGHQEGDNLIKEAASILINNQVENTEIIRTNGNEFLIYMIDYDEKQVVSYIRKLTKDFKDLSHGFGAAIGYSMITDAIKTIDDAINEATLDMKNNKEEIQN